jgi:hypothetical protein
MLTKRAVDWKAIGQTLLTPEVLGAIIGGTGAPLATYLARRKKQMPLLQRIAELLGAGVLGAGAGAGVGYGGKKGVQALSKLLEKAPEAAKPGTEKPKEVKKEAPGIKEVVPTWGEPGEAEILEKMRREAGEEVVPTWGEPGEAEILEKMRREGILTPDEAAALLIEQATRPLAGETSPEQKSRSLLVGLMSALGGSTLPSRGARALADLVRGKKTTGEGRGIRPWGLRARESLDKY